MHEGCCFPLPDPGPLSWVESSQLEPFAILRLPQPHEGSREQSQVLVGHSWVITLRSPVAQHRICGHEKTGLMKLYHREETGWSAELHRFPQQIQSIGQSATLINIASLPDHNCIDLVLYVIFLELPQWINVVFAHPQHIWCILLKSGIINYEYIKLDMRYLRARTVADLNIPISSGGH